jgi:stage III sporulation protein AD
MTGGLSIIAIVALALLGTVIAVFLKETKLKTAAMLVIMALAAVIFLRLLPSLQSLFDSFAALANDSGVNSYYITLLLKIIGLAYLAEFGAQMCRDAGEGAAALKIEFAAKIGILLLSLPVVVSIIQSVLLLLE